MNLQQLVCVLSCVLLINTAAAELREQLRYFETLSHVDVVARRRRSVEGAEAASQDVHFTAFGRSFDLVLSKGSPVISTDFTAKLIYRDGLSVPFHVDNNNFFTGHLSENINITADAYMEDGLWTASVYSSEDVYTIEPSLRHLPPSDNYSMIAYRQSDIKWDNIFPDLNTSTNKRQKFCNGIHPDDPFQDSDFVEEETGQQKRAGSARVKRGIPQENTCHIMAVADYTFFKGPGGGFPHRTANSIIQTLQKVDRIYRSTLWNQETQLTGLGLQIKELRIHAEVTNRDNFHRNGKHYNMYDGSISWPYSELLEQFGMDDDVSKFCLSHLFTYRRFAGGVLGLAYIAGNRARAVGGICSIKYSRADRSYNTGFSSAMNTKGNNLLSLEATIVTAHEFGHNWGAEHDAETSECAPSAFNNGRFIMFPYAVSGYDENNDKFSPCSKRYISEVLSARADTCFKALSSNIPLCGNGIVDKDEDCDGGGMGLSGLDPCCSESCRFKGAATCSSVNYGCCLGCQMAPAKTLCREASQEVCQEAAYCSGYSLYCPQSGSLGNNTSCIDEGKCINGQCLDYCTYAGQLRNQELRPCRCEDVANSCLRCCKSEDDVCMPLDGSSPDSFMQDGRPCFYGYCEGGKCQKTSADMIQRLFDFIEQLDSSTFVAFMRSNIVGTVLIFSLVIWIPLSWTISCLDKRKERRSKEEEEFWKKKDALLNQTMPSARGSILAKKLKDYNIRPSKIQRATRPPDHWTSPPLAASVQSGNLVPERQHWTYHKPRVGGNGETTV